MQITQKRKQTFFAAIFIAFKNFSYLQLSLSYLRSHHCALTVGKKLSLQRKLETVQL